ncbi:MAG: hypothetical protein HY558_00430 [Euryarchaeota archaeon]|nr:hypothetical protein [Euryarchaeota archaeon]
MALEIKSEMPLEGVVAFYQAVERFHKYLRLGGNPSGDRSSRLLCMAHARENLDTAYREFLSGYQLILPLRRMVKPLPLTGEVSTEELGRIFRAQMEALEPAEVQRVLGLLNRLKEKTLEEAPLEPEDGDVRGLVEVALQVKAAAEKFISEDLLAMVRKHLQEAARDPEAFKSMFPLPPKPLKDEYRV